ncbi:MAG: DUF1585 domain-containing protein, partial [Myxococcales bacterium]
HDDGLPQCTISGAGELAGVGAFSGPAELGDRLMQSDRLEACVARQVFRFALGRHDQYEDSRTVDLLADAFRQGRRDFRALLAAVAGSDAFIYRKTE